MATPNEERFIEAWRALDESTARPGWNTVPIPSRSGSLLLAGRHQPRNQESLLIGFTGAKLPNQSALPQCKGFTIETVELPFRGRQYYCLAIMRQPSASVEIFSAMLDDIITVLEHSERTEPEHVLAIIDRIVSWQRFMSREDEGVLKGEQELGLIGELQVLRLLLATGIAPSFALEWWQGPLDSLHDFIGPRGDVEVKASTRTGVFSASVGSLDQLDETLVQPLFVATVQYDLSSNGLRLPDYVDLIRKVLSVDPSTVQTFEGRLLAAGYHQLSASRYHRRFSYLITNFYEVSGQLPRLTKGNVPPGVIEAVYQVELDAAKFKSLALDEVLQRIG